MPSFKGSGMGRVFPTNSLGEYKELNNFVLLSESNTALLCFHLYTYSYYPCYSFPCFYLLYYLLPRRAAFERHEGSGASVCTSWL